MERVEKIIALANEMKATDIHIEIGEAVYYRRGDINLLPTEEIIIDQSFFEVLLNLTYEDFKSKQSIDLSISINNQDIRVHIYLANKKLCGALRLLSTEIPTIDNDPQKNIWQKICNRKNGLILITGPTGSGKSYTLASLLQYINMTRKNHIVMLEDPIELNLKNNNSIIHQREIGRDTKSMLTGIYEALREDPDVIMIGEIRDSETIKAALLAAETGHLVFATMHTKSAVQSIGRIISAFSIEEADEIRSILSQVLVCVICQELLLVNNEFYPLRDILINTSAVANLIRQKKEHQISALQEMDSKMQSRQKAISEAINKYGQEVILKIINN